ncbi:hypothetical protein MKW92_035352 [Papaver armeniacum]|nr:hypothetical protein MKW92_035352 [Papaver armeniacum]
MNQYHVYEAIGRGKYSTVYKARKKKTIEYFAVKSVDKSHKSKLLQEVRILHSLNNPNVLKFYSWYETSAHLWLVLEYCVGGDLMTLLRQDSQLPEDSIHDFGRDLLKALQYLHSNGIIYCDLKPSNILLDENGRTKLCDFELARRLIDISKTPSSQLPQAKRGTPCYMAPELFQDGGVHSYASDFWALGCVLYECYAGRPPFVEKEFTRLVKAILSDPYPPLPGNPSRSFVSLINCLLIKDPAERITWSDLCLHDFWITKFNVVALPPEPAFLDMIEQYAKPCLSERNGDKPLQSKTPPKTRERDSKGVPKQDENSISGARGFESPAKNTPSGKKMKKKEFSIAPRAVNLLRLSRIAKTNLQKENDKENYRRPMPKNSENDAEVKMENNDMELDFSENVEDEANDEATDEADGSDSTSTTDETLPIQTQDNDRRVESDHNTNQSDSPSDTDMIICDDSQETEQESCTPQFDVAATPPSVGHPRKGKMLKAGSDSGPNADSSKSSKGLSDVHWHASDLSVRPVMPSRKVPVSDFIKMPKEHLEKLNHRIISVLNGNNPISEKQNVIRYLEMLSGNADAANIVTNGQIMPVLVKMFRLSKASTLRVQLASLIGLLIRHSTFIEDDLSNSGILGALTDGLRDKQDKVRRFSMAALGELLFYISTQSENDRESNPPESPSKDTRSASGWQVPGPVIALVSSVLQPGEDDLTQLYALRTIENICSQGGEWAARFNSQDVIRKLSHIFKAVGKQESTRLTAGSCLVRLVRSNPPSIQSVMDKLSFKDTATALIKGNPREQQIGLNLLIMAIHTNMNRQLHLVEEKHLIQSLLSLLEQGTEVLRGKTLVLIALLCNNDQKWLPHFFWNAKLLSAVDRLGKEKDEYVQRCLDAFVGLVTNTVPGLLKTITNDVREIMGGRRLGQISSLGGRATAKTITNFFAVILHLLGSSSFKQRVMNPQVLQQVANLIKLVESPFQGRDDFQITLLRILESMTDELSFIVANPDIFISQVLPSLAMLYKGNKDGDARFLCLKLLFDVMVVFLNEPFEDEKQAENLKLISNGHFLPLYPTLIEDEEPIPMYAQKLLVMLIEFNYIKISDILHSKTVSQCFEFLHGDLSSANVNNVKLCLALASAPELDTKILSHLRVVRKIGNLLEFVNAKEMEDFLEPTLALCKAFLLRVMGALKGVPYPKEPALLSDGSSDTRVINQQNYIKDIPDFGSNVGVLLELSSSDEARVADLASECVILLLKAAPREATIGLLTNLPKVVAVLESWSRVASSLLLKRMLHAVGYSCRQYMSQAMILSISVSDITKVETIVSILKTSGIPGVADAAFIVGLELQRLPRCK